MGWKDLLQTGDETVVSPWVGGRSLRSGERSWKIEGRLPPEFGWNEFSTSGRKATWKGPIDPATETLGQIVRGYLVGDRLVSDEAHVDPDPARISEKSERVYLIEDGLDRFVRVSAGRPFEGAPLIYRGQEMPLGPEGDVLQAYLDRTPSVNAIPAVTPALDACFRMEVWQRAEAERLRAELEKRRAEEEEQRLREERRQLIATQLGTAEGRRAMAAVDFEAGAKAALAVTGASLLDIRRSTRRGEMVVRFRFMNRRFECVCDERTLRIIDAGICLTAHYDDENFEEGTKGDTFFTLESLPSVIREADREGKLVIFRHVA